MTKTRRSAAPAHAILSRSRFSRWAGAVVIGVAVIAAVRWQSSRTVAFPPPRAGLARPAVAATDFAGAEVCASCHAEQFAAWQGSTHGRAGGPPSPETVIAPFDGSPMRFRDATVTPAITAEGAYTFTVAQPGRDPVVFRVDGVVGRGHMVGGGTQGFLSSHPDGTVRFLPFDYAPREDVWFCNTNTRVDMGWVPITPTLALRDCGDWPPTRVFGTEARFANCQQCHGSQVSLRFDPTARRYDTTIRSLRIDCESCHGPAADHAARAATDALTADSALGVRSLSLLGEDASLEVCFQCHAVKDATDPGYLPGRPLADHYALLAPLVADRPFFPDGRVRRFAYQLNHIASDCYINGTMTCVDCHAPHGQGYRDAFARPLPDRFADGQCTACHASKASDPTIHTHHAAGSPGSRCVACHMPYLQHQEVGTRIRFARSDHTIPIPRPAFDEQLGVRNACRGCHADRSIDTLQATVTRWYGALKPHKPLVRTLTRVEEGARVDPRLLVASGDGHRLAQIAALNVLMERYLRPNQGELDPGLDAPLRDLAQHSDIDIRAAALAALHYAAGDVPATRRFLAQRLRRLPAEVDRRVRMRWAWVLGAHADRMREARATTQAVAAYRKALEVLPDDPRLLHNLGQAYGDLEDLTAAIGAYERSLAADSLSSLTWVNLGLVLRRVGRDGDAARAHQRAQAINPHDPLPAFNLGNIHLRAEEYAAAIVQYRRAVALDASLALAHYYLARSLIAVDSLSAALAAASRAVEFDPTNAGARQMVAELERVLGR